MFSAIKNHKKKKGFLVKFSTLFQTNSFIHFRSVRVIVLRTESLGTVCTLARERVRVLNVQDWPASQQEASKHHNEMIPALQFVGATHTAFIDYEILHASPFLTFIRR